INPISNVAVLTEGFDAPATSAIFLARPTRSRVLFTQIIGRGLRPFPGKHDCLLVDLTVTDTRAIEIGQLLDRMTTCPKCGAEYHYGMKQCPHCGYEPPAIAGDGAALASVGNGAFNGTDLVANYAPLFERAFAAWYQGDDGFLSCTLGSDDGALIIMPPLEDPYYRLIHVPKGADKRPAVLQRNDDLSSLMLSADQEIERFNAKVIANKEAYWRVDAATPAQLNWLRRMGDNPPPGLSKGAASQRLTHLFAVQRLMDRR
ncbi:MAG: hypothetical protein CUN54_08835, partial [Phototrophicales bacterium]